MKNKEVKKKLKHIQTIVMGKLENYSLSFFLFHFPPQINTHTNQIMNTIQYTAQHIVHTHVLVIFRKIAMKSSFKRRLFNATIMMEFLMGFHAHFSLWIWRLLFSYSSSLCAFIEFTLDLSVTFKHEGFLLIFIFVAWTHTNNNKKTE